MTFAKLIAFDRPLAGVSAPGQMGRTYAEAEVAQATQAAYGRGVDDARGSADQQMVEFRADIEELRDGVFTKIAQLETLLVGQLRDALPGLAEKLERMLAGIQQEEGTADPEVRSPMPGTVVSVAVSDGETVAEGQILLAVEAMKMEHQLVASVHGTVHLTVATGDLVKADQVLASIHATPTSAVPTTKENQP